MELPALGGRGVGIPLLITNEAQGRESDQIAGHRIEHAGDLKEDVIRRIVLAGVLGAVDHWREILSLPRSPREKTAHLQITESLRRRLGERSYSLA